MALDSRVGDRRLLRGGCGLLRLPILDGDVEMAHQKVTVKLVGEDGNAFSIMGRVSRALKRSGQPEAAAEYLKRATEGNYDHLLQVTLEYVNEPGDEDDEDEEDEDLPGLDILAGLPSDGSEEIAAKVESDLHAEYGYCPSEEEMEEEKRIAAAAGHPIDDEDDDGTLCS